RGRGGDRRVHRVGPRPRVRPGPGVGAAQHAAPLRTPGGALAARHGVLLQRGGGRTLADSVARVAADALVRRIAMLALRLLVPWLAIICCPLAGVAQPKHLDKVTVRLDWINSGYQAVWYHARDRGILGEHGIDLEVH